MKIWILGICVVWGCISAAITITPATTTTTKLPVSTSPSTPNTPVSTAASGSTPSVTKKPSILRTKHNELLRRELAISPLTHRLRGRVVLASTRVEGSNEWGVSADQAEVACDRIARYKSESNPPSFVLHTLLRRFIPIQASSRSQPMEGHLLSVGSGYEVMALARLLDPLPKGSYWTGGRVTRYRVNSMRNPGHTDHIVLTWTDGRTGRPSVLGMTKLDEKQLREGYTYCLALNLREAAWQARDCSDQLPYSCLITPRQIGFSNQASGAKTTETVMTTTNSPQQPPTTEEMNGDSTETTEIMEETEPSDNILHGIMNTPSTQTPMATEASSMMTTPVLSGTTQATQKNIVTELLNTQSQMKSTERTWTSMDADETTEPGSEESFTTTQGSLLKDVFTATPEMNRMQPKPVAQEMTTAKFNLAAVSGMITEEQNGAGVMIKLTPSTPSTVGNVPMTTMKLLNDKMTTDKNLLLTAGTTESTSLKSGNVSPLMTTIIPDTATLKLSVAQEGIEPTRSESFPGASRGWTGDTDNENEDDW